MKFASRPATEARLAGVKKMVEGLGHPYVTVGELLHLLGLSQTVGERIAVGIHLDTLGFVNHMVKFRGKPYRVWRIDGVTTQFDNKEAHFAIMRYLALP